MTRFCDLVGLALTAIAIWSIVAIIVALTLDNIEAAWRFLFALGGSGLTLVALSLFEDRR